MGSLPAAAGANQFGKYSLVARLASGGMAEIFLARLTGAAGFEKLVCIKRIHPHLARDRQFVAMFLDEARVAARITHPNVCQVFELGEIEGSYYLAMEYLEGVPLACFRRHDYYGPAPDPRLVAGIAIQACEGLHHAHQLKTADGREMEVVHRDVSPQNLFVTTDGIVKVLDFGIAKMTDATMRTSTGAIKGTYAYMAPEQLRGERLDRRTDVFAMGIVLWETLARRHLFKRDTEFLMFQAITGDLIEDICAVRPDVPPALSAVIKTALARDRDQRYPTARALGEAIAAAVLPLTAAAISDELQRAFPVALGEQAELIRAARAGRVFDLDVERGPAVGHGAQLTSTASSHQHAVLDHAAGLSSSAAGAIIATPPPGPTARRWWRPLAIAAVAVAVGGGAAVVSTRLTRDPAGSAAGPQVIAAAAPSPPPAAASTAGSAAHPGESVPAQATVRDMPAGPAPAGPAPVDPAPAGPAQPQVAGAPTAAMPTPRPPIGDAPNPASSVSVAAKSAEPSAGSAARHAAAAPPRQSGYITIDSLPVYAVIYIDGRKYGETPLVRLELPPGRHVVHAVAPSGDVRDLRITIEPGKTAPTMRISW